MVENIFPFLFIALFFMAINWKIVKKRIMLNRLNQSDKARLYSLYSMINDRINQSGGCVNNLCYEISRLHHDTPEIITMDDINFLRKHLESQKPTLFVNTKFYLNKNYIGGVYWWHRVNSRTSLQRRLFVLRLMNLTKPN